MKYHIDPNKLAIHNKLVVFREYYENQQLHGEFYYFNNRYHNPNAPAVRKYYESGRLRVEEYCVNGLFHNPNGPAVRYWDANGELMYVGYWLDGLSYSKEEYAKLVK